MKVVLLTFVSAFHQNLIYIVTDGAGPAAFTLTRDYLSRNLFSEKFQVGSVITHSADSYITDSAAGATAFACQTRTNNGFIGIDPNFVPIPSFLEAAKLKGYTTGVVLNNDITDATPASFYAHTRDRSYHDVIANQLVNGTEFGTTIDLIIGGGIRHFIPQTMKGSKRLDNVNLLEGAKEHGWRTVISSIQEFWKLNKNTELPLLAPLVMGDLPYEIDRPAHVPSLKDQVVKTLEIMENQNNKFVLLIESARIDWAGHANSPAALVQEMIEFERMLVIVYEFASKYPNTLVISTSDHETGGITLGSTDHSPYRYFPHKLSSVKRSVEYISAELIPLKLGIKALHKELVKYLGFRLTTKELKLVYSGYLNTISTESYLFPWNIGEVLKERTEIGMSTHGHTAVDVPLFTFGNAKYRREHPLQGTIHNHQLGNYIWNYLGLDYKKSKSLLRNQETRDPHGRPAVPEK